jgi:preprotein translocase subunit YajC
MAAQVKRKIKVNFFLALLILVGLFLVFVFLAVLDQKIVENRANEFCDTISVGALFDRVKLQARVEQITNTRIVVLPDGAIRNLDVSIQFLARLPHYYTCSFSVRNGVIAHKAAVEYKD